MKRNTVLLALIPALCAILIALRLTMLKSVHTGDFSLGVSVGFILGLSIVSIAIIVFKRGTS
jgi:hypothetical protein